MISFLYVATPSSSKDELPRPSFKCGSSTKVTTSEAMISPSLSFNKDKPFCEGTIEKIGERRFATYKYESTLHCALRLGGGCNWITPSNVGSFLGIYNLDNKINNKGK